MKAKILIADDEADIRNELSQYLTRKGYECLVFSDGEQAFRGIMDHSPDVLITDMKMPGMGGAELIALTRNSAPRTIVIAITGHGARTGLDFVEDVDIDAGFAKPLSLKNLLAKIEELLEPRGSRAAPGQIG